MKLLVLLTALLTFALITGCGDDTTSASTHSCLESRDGVNLNCDEMGMEPTEPCAADPDVSTDADKTYTVGTACPSGEKLKCTVSMESVSISVYFYSEIADDATCEMVGM